MFAHVVIIGIIIILLLSLLSLCSRVLSLQRGMPCLHTVPGTQAFPVWLRLSATPPFIICVPDALCMPGFSPRCLWVPCRALLFFTRSSPSPCQWVSSATETSLGSSVSTWCPVTFQYSKPNLHIQNLLCVQVLLPRHQMLPSISLQPSLLFQSLWHTVIFQNLMTFSGQHQAQLLSLSLFSLFPVQGLVSRINFARIIQIPGFERILQYHL